MPAEKPALTARAKAVVDEATARVLNITAISVTSPADAQAASELLRDVKREATALTEHRMSLTRPIDAYKAAVMDAFRPATEHLAKVENEQKRELLTYQRAEEQARREAEARARQQAEEERQRLMAEAEAARKDGDDFGARLLETDAQLVNEPILPIHAPAMQGVSKRTTYRAEIYDFYALVKAAAENPGALLMLLQPNEQALNSMARSGGKSFALPGVKAVEVETLAVRSR